MSGVLRLERLHIRTGQATVLTDYTLDVAAGTSIAVTGPARSGKSTVLATLAGMRPPAAGHVLLQGRPPTLDQVGVVDQQHFLIGGLTAAENVAVRTLTTSALGLHGWAEIEELLHTLGLPPSAWHNLVEQLSGGQQQRVAIARALIGPPPLLCLDDPVSELDSDSANTVTTALHLACGNGAVLAIATPNPQLANQCDHVIELARDTSSR